MSATLVENPQRVWWHELPLILGWIGVAGTVAAVLGPWQWLLENLGAFRSQYFWLVMLGLLFARHKQLRIPASIFLLAAYCNGLAIGSVYWSGGGGTRNGKSDLRVIYANVLKTNDNYQPLLDLVARENPEVVILAEYDPTWAAACQPLRERFPYYIEDARQDYMGMACFSTLPPEELTVEYLSTSQLPSTRLKLHIGSESLTIFGAHPYPPLMGSWTALRNEELAAIALVAAQEPGAKLIIGDLNVTPDMHSFRQLCQFADVRDSRAGFGPCSTWPTFFPLLGVRLDHALVSETIGVARHRTGPNIGSDHRPIIVDLQIRPVPSP